MLTKQFEEVYMKFKMHFYREVFRKWKGREASLTTVETFCMEIIHNLNRPTVSQFAEFTSLSSANAAAKVNNLIRKGYLTKTQSQEDRREYYLEPTQKYLDYYGISSRYQEAIIAKVEKQFSEEEKQLLTKLLHVLDEELNKSIS